MRTRRFATAILLAIGLGAIAVGRVSGHPRASRIVVITLDTTRADRLSPYGLLDSAMPALERLAREGVVFDRALSVAPLTLPAHSSLFTGLLPVHHGVGDNAGAPLGPAPPTLAELLRTHGYHTAAFVGSVVLNRDRGLARGFDLYSDVSGKGPDGQVMLQRRGADVVSAALQWLAGMGGEPFLLWIHLYDPHRPYDPPEPYLSTSSDAYVGEIRYADAQIGRVIDALARHRWLDTTTIVVVGDHGESLGEHGERDHGLTLYESVLHVPLIIRTPGAEARRVASTVRLTDIMPTILDLARIRAPAGDGASLRELLQGLPDRQNREAYAESVAYPQRLGERPRRALRDDRFTFIEAPDPRLYDRRRDPREVWNIAAERTALAAAMRARIATLSGDAGGAASPSAVPAELRERLAALGYR